MTEHYQTWVIVGLFAIVGALVGLAFCVVYVGVAVLTYVGQAHAVFCR